MRNQLKLLLVAILPFLSVHCISEDTIISAVESSGLPNYMLMHKNPAVGDMPVYSTGNAESRIKIEKIIQPDLYEVSQNIGNMPFSLRLQVKGSGEILKAELLNIETGTRKPIKMQANGPNSVEKIKTVPLEKPTEVVTPAGSFKVSQARQIIFRPTGEYRSRSTSLVNDDVPFLSVRTIVISEELSREEMARLDPSHGIFTGIGDFTQRFELKEFKKN